MLSRVRRRAAAALLAGSSLILLLALAPPAHAVTPPDVTWAGAGTGSLNFNDFSNSANWVGGTTLTSGEALGTVTFPDLSSCDTGTPTAACYNGVNDVTGLTAQSLAINMTPGYYLSGNGISLGAGGLTATAGPGGSSASDVADLELPLTLTAAQTWTIQGGGQNQQLNVASATGNFGLTIDLSNQTFLGFGSDTEVGNVSASGNGIVTLNSSGGPASLNGTDGNSVTLSGGAGLVEFGTGSAGPLSMSGTGSLQIGQGLPPESTLAVQGTATLGSSNRLLLFIDNAQNTAGTDSSLLSATGQINLGGAILQLGQGTSSSNNCANLVPGTVYTLVKSTTGISGTLTQMSNTPIANGDTISMLNECGGNTNQNVIINYTADTVTATIAAATPPPTSSAPPVISGTLQAGQQLSTTDGTWSGSPSYSYQWYDCTSTQSTSCTMIPGATNQTYTLQPSDVGSYIEVGVTATNAGGSNTAYSSVSSTAVLPAAPLNSIAPAITGTTTQGDTLTASSGTWSPTPTSYVYQWYDCNSTGSVCAAIPGATSSTYTLTSTDVGDTIQVTVVADNHGVYSKVATSALTGAVAPPATTVTTQQPTVPSAAQIRSALISALGVRHKLASFKAILKAKGYRTAFNAPSAGELVIKWLYVEKTHGHKHGVLIARAKVTITGAHRVKVKIGLTSAGKKLLEHTLHHTHAHRLRLLAMGSFNPSDTGKQSASRKITLHR